MAAWTDTSAAAAVGGGVATGRERFDRSVVEDCLSSIASELRSEMRRDVQNLHLDMLRQFEEQQQVIGSMLERHAKGMVGLQKENEALRRENEDLRRLY